MFALPCTGSWAPWIRRFPEPEPCPPAVLRPRQELRLARLDRGDRLTDSIQRGMLGTTFRRKRKEGHAWFGFQKSPRVSRSIQRDVGQLRDRRNRHDGAIRKYKGRFGQNHQKEARHDRRLRAQARCSESRPAPCRLSSSPPRRRNHPHLPREPWPQRSTWDPEGVQRFNFGYASGFPFGEQKAGIVFACDLPSARQSRFRRC